MPVQMLAFQREQSFCLNLGSGRGAALYEGSRLLCFKCFLALSPKVATDVFPTSISYVCQICSFGLLLCGSKQYHCSITVLCLCMHLRCSNASPLVAPRTVTRYLKTLRLLQSQHDNQHYEHEECKKPLHRSVCN